MISLKAYFITDCSQEYYDLETFENKQTHLFTKFKTTGDILLCDEIKFILYILIIDDNIHSAYQELCIEIFKHTLCLGLFDELLQLVLFD